MSSKVFILVFLTYISLVASSLAPFITKCKWDDSKCLKESTKKAIPIFADGIPELHVDHLDPLMIKHVDASTPNFKLIVDNIKVTGLKNCQAKKITRNIETSKINVKILCAVDFIGQYLIDGKLSILPIQGNGNLIAKVPKIQLAAEIDIKDKTGKDGKKHWGVKSWKHSFELKEQSYVKFENLFPDNEILRKTTEELISTNGNLVITEIGPLIIKALAASVIGSIDEFFDAVPVEELTLD